MEKRMNNFGKRRANNETYLIAELSANHGNSLETAIETIRAAAASGADAIKVQTYTADTITLDCDNEYFQIKHETIWDGTTLHKLYEEASMPWEWHAPLQKVANELGMDFFSTPFDFTAVDLLENLNVPVYKIASLEINDIPLLELVASKKKPILISTGIASLADIEEAVNTCRKAGNNDIVLLKCTSSYPAPYEEANLLTIPNLAATFGVTAGLSDHTMGHVVPLGAVALGAKVIEKHFILNRDVPSADASFSMLPDEFKLMAESIRILEKALGKITYELSDKTKKSKDFSRSLFIVKNVKAGETFTHENLKSIRPGYGMHTRNLKNLIGKVASKDILRGTPMKEDFVKN
ncbi:pseudaminic acid synthase [Bdellovibrio bacteriovorus]|uniref:pseudaminic acid synthase n=1 Tax=Bdellovibrio bacteriovorus TaxID=959 RepID=UPI0035A735B8